MRNINGDIQDGHKHRKPQLLGAYQRVRVGSPFSPVYIVHIAHHHESPGRLFPVSSGLGSETNKTYSQTQPSDKAVVPFEHVVIVTSLVVRYRALLNRTP